MVKPAGVLEVDHVLNVCQRRSNDLGVTVRFDKRAATASTDGKNITLPPVGHPITQSQLDRLYGFVIHECGHHLRPEAFDVLNTARPPPHLAAIYNIIEDDGMERERATEWAGDCKALSIANADIVRQVGDNWKGKEEGDFESEALATMLIQQLSRLEWDEYSQGAVSSLIRNMPSKAIELMDELRSEGWVEKYRTTNTALDTWDVAVDLAKRLYPDNDQEMYEDMRAAGKAGAAEGGSEHRDDSKDSEGMHDGRDGDGAAAAPAVASDTPDDSSEVVSWRDCVFSDHEDKAGGAPSGVAIDWEGYMGSNAHVMPTDLINVVDLSRPEREISSEANGWGPGPDLTTYLPTDAHSKQFANRVRRYIQALARSTVDREKYHGKIDKSAIVRLALPPIDGGEYNKRIFYDQRKHTMKDTAIFVLTDWSGSMNGEKMKYAADASQRLVYTFDRILNVPVALALFSDSASDCDIGYVKPYNTRGMSATEIASRFSKFYYHSCGNNDSDAVHWAYQQIKRRKEARKILIVISDGAPTDSWKGHAHSNLKYVTKAIEQDGGVELYGVGVLSDCVRHYYTNYKVLHNVHQINDTQFNVIKEGDNVKRNKRR